MPNVTYHRGVAPSAVRSFYIEEHVHCYAQCNLIHQWFLKNPNLKTKHRQHQTQKLKPSFASGRVPNFKLQRFLQNPKNDSESKNL